MSEAKKFDVEFKDNQLCLGLDTNQDGEKLLNAKISLSEAIQEALQRKESVKVEGAKIVEFEFKLTKLVLKVDTDQDDEDLLELEIDLAEALDEVGVLKS